MSDIVPITAHGAQLLRDELKHLKSVERPRIIESISEARAHGDLRENAEYHAAREQQSFTEGRIQEIETKLSKCRIIDVTQIPNEGKVIFGSTVTLTNVDTDATVVYRIVGVDEADLKEDKISVTSPLARGLVGKFAGDVVDVETPQGVTTYEILKVEYL
ncbi:MAG: transcription elongation factor GreA [Gammaproteobacteria bacterium RIFCSPHIGHO2_12_FULL_45_9]|nr:MAG: transcription elongation factor GreA [Gammaproteobacteria bacterium RIFCSPHIGHO2_12_FULL_45_9]